MPWSVTSKPEVAPEAIVVTSEALMTIGSAIMLPAKSTAAIKEKNFFMI
jgi:hypothetical protein